MIITLSKKIVFFFKEAYLKYKCDLGSPRPFCQISELNLQKKEVAILCHGLRIITIRSHISEIIGDPSIILNLPSEQACWLGYYYGKLCIEQGDISQFHSNRGSFLLSFTKGKFKITALDGRKCLISYVDTKTKKTYQESPLTIAQNVHIICQFDPSQACYIGILAGAAVAKHGEEIISRSKKTIFTLVKN